MPRESHPKNTWYNATNPPEMTVTVCSAMPAGTSMLVSYLGLFLPGLGFGGFIGGFVAGLNRRLSARRRVVGFDWLTMMVPLLCGVACGLSSIVLSNCALTNVIGDVWFGNPFVDFLFPRTLICAGVLALVLPLTALGFRGRILRGLDEEPDLPDIGKMLRRGRRTGMIGLAYITGYVLYAVVTGSIEFKMLDAARHLGPLISGLFPPLIMRFAMMDLYRPSRVDAELTERAKSMSSAFGAEICEVRVATGRYAKKNANAFAFPGKRRIVVTQKAVEALSPHEMDWLLAHELAHFSDNRVYKGLFPAPLTGAASVLVVLCCLGSFGASPWPILLVGLIPLFAFLTLNEVCEVRRRLEYEADIQAMVTIRDLDAAISGLVVVRDQSQHPKLQDTELDVHPKLMKRIKALRAVAAEVGILSRGAESPMTSAAGHLDGYS